MLRVWVLGNLRLEVAGVAAPLPGSRRARSLLAWLALHPGEHPRSEVAGRFWPDVLDQSARASLRGALAELRRSLGEAAGALIATRERVGLRRGPEVWIDAAAFATALGDQRLPEALALARGELLADLDDDWVYPLREAHRHDVVALTAALADAAEARGDLPAALSHTRRQATLDPLSEEAHRALMRRLAACGDRAAAVATYEALAGRLRRHLGMAPAAETRALLATLRDGDGDGTPAATAPVTTPAGAPGPAAPVTTPPRAPEPAAPVTTPPRAPEPAAPVTTPPRAPEPAASVTAPARAPGPAAPLSSSHPLLRRSGAPILGRAAELERVDRLWREAGDGATRLLFVAGDPGIGKTALATEGARRAAGDGGVVLYGRCDEDGLMPYEPWVQVVGHLVANAPAAWLEPLADHGGPELARLAPELRRRLPDLAEPVHAEPDTERWRLFDAVGALLETVSGERPAMLVLDDLHWADRSSLLLLRHLMRSRPALRLLVVGTYRAVELEPDAPLLAALADLRREHLFAELGLEGLGEEEVRSLVTRRRGAPGDAGFVRALHRETEGNPFFVEEVLRNLPEPGERALAGAPVPQGVREAVERRLARLSAPVRETLGTAAVIGRDFDLELLERVAPASPDALVGLLEAAIAAQVVEEVGVGRYSFVHALIRTTLYDGLSLTRRALLHQQIGQALEDLRLPTARPPYGELARHFWVAASGELARVVDYASRAARQALEQLAYDEAAGHARQALRALEAGDDAPPERRAPVLLTLGEALARAGDVDGARQAFAAALAAGSAAGAPSILAEAALGFAGPAWRSFGEVDDQAIALLEEALAGLGDAPDALRARLLARLACSLYFTRAPDRVGVLAGEALALARACDDRGALAAALEARLYATWQPDGLDERLATAAELLALADETGYPEVGAQARRWMVVALLEAGQIGRARSETARHAQVAARLRQPYEEMYVAVFGAMWALLDGRYEEAQARSGDVMAAGQHRGGADALQFVGVHAVSLCHDHGGMEHLAEPLRANAVRYPAIPAWRAALAYALAAGGDHAAARSELAGLSPIAERLPRDANWFAGMAFAALACEALGDAPLALELRGALAPYASRVVLLGAGGALWGSVSRYLGVLSAVAGDHAAAAAHWEDALVRETAMDARPWVADAAAGLAEALLALGEPAEQARAAALLARAEAAARGLGLQPLLGRIARLQATPASAPAPSAT